MRKTSKAGTHSGAARKHLSAQGKGLWVTDAQIMLIWLQVRDTQNNFRGGNVREGQV